MSQPLLVLNNVTKNFGGVTAVNGLTMEIHAGEVHALIGPNGAGKTTVFNLISGIVPVSHGSIVFLGRNLIGLRPDQVAYRGISRTFQNIRLFGQLSVLDNVLIGAHRVGRAELLGALLKPRWVRDEERKARERATELLAFVGLEGKAMQLAGSLPYGDQRRVEIARALAAAPKLLLLDEPTAGMNPQETAQLLELVLKLRDRGITVFLIAHDMQLVMRASDRVTVLNYGRKIAEGSPAEVRNNPEVIMAYLGAHRHARG